jgi:hypothetical protein
LVKRTTTRRVDRSRAARYADTGRVFLESARALADVADEDAPYGNAIALLSIHATISYTDALTIAYGERKSADQHGKAVDTLRAVLGSRLDNDQVRTLRLILREKDMVSYQGTYYSLDQGRRLLDNAEEYCSWARDLFETRPGESA